MNKPSIDLMGEKNFDNVYGDKDGKGNLEI